MIRAKTTNNIQRSDIIRTFKKERYFMIMDLDLKTIDLKNFGSALNIFADKEMPFQFKHEGNNEYILEVDTSGFWDLNPILEGFIEELHPEY